jgi:hypothetical protein
MFRLSYVPAFLRSSFPTFQLTYVPAYLYATASQPIWLTAVVIVMVIVVVHHQFKRNTYLSHYVIGYFSISKSFFPFFF